MRRKPKIAFIIGSLTSGGAERVVTTLANSLSEEMQVTIITFKNDKPFYPLSDSVNLVSCKDEISPPRSFLDSILLNLGLYRKIISILKSNQIELVIGFITMANVLTVLSAKYLKISCIISERNNPYADDTPKFWRLLAKYVYPFSDHLVVQTGLIKKFYNDSIDTKKITVLPNPISKDLTEKRRATEKENIILNVAKLHYQKNQELLIKSFYHTEHEGWKLVILGEGEKRESLEKLIKELGLEEKVILLGRKNNVHDYYNKAKIFAFTSDYEGFPNALIEAMHFGLACVSTDCPTGPSELIVDGENGFLVPVNNVQELVSRLQILIDQPKIRKKFADSSSLVTQKFESQNVISQWKELILRYVWKTF